MPSRCRVNSGQSDLHNVPRDRLTAHVELTRVNSTCLARISSCCPTDMAAVPRDSGGVTSESLDIERRHMPALTWDAMFKSRRAAILADGGGGGVI